MPDSTDFIDINKFIQSNLSAYKQSHNQNVGLRIKSELSILDYVPQAGFTLKRIGNRGLYTTVEHDSMRIDPVKNCYYFNSQADSDSIIGFVAKYIFNGDMKAAIKELSSHLDSDHSVNYQRQISPVSSPDINKDEIPFVLPLADANMRRVYAYLIKSRYIDPAIVQYFTDQKMLYQDTHGNCVFVSYNSDNSPVFACYRGTNTHIRFLGDVKGADYNHGFYIDHGSKELIVTESVIDAMSIMSILKAKGKDFKQYNYLQLAGTQKSESLFYHLNHNNSINHVLLCLDNDSAGRISSISIRDALKKDFKLTAYSMHFPDHKDWNETLVKCINLGRSPADLPLFDKKSSKIHKRNIER